MREEHTPAMSFVASGAHTSIGTNEEMSTQNRPHQGLAAVKTFQDPQTNLYLNYLSHYTSKFCIQRSCKTVKFL